MENIRKTFCEDGPTNTEVNLFNFTEFGQYISNLFMYLFLVKWMHLLFCQFIELSIWK